MAGPHLNTEIVQMIKDNELPEIILSTLEEVTKNIERPTYAAFMHLSLCCAVENKHVELMKHILQHERYQPVKKNDMMQATLPSPLWLLGDDPEDELLDMLLENGIDPTHRVMIRDADKIMYMESPIEAAIKADKPLAIKILMRMTSWGKYERRLYPLHHSCRYSSQNFTEQLLNNCPILLGDLNESDKDGETVLTLVAPNHTQLVPLFLDLGVDPSLNASNSGMNILHKLCSLIGKGEKPSSGFDLVTLLKKMIDRGIDVNAERKDGQAPLSIICSVSQYLNLRNAKQYEQEVIMELLRYLCEISNPETRGKALLMLSAQVSYILCRCLAHRTHPELFSEKVATMLPNMHMVHEKFKILLENGADPKSQDKCEKDSLHKIIAALDMAEKGNILLAGLGEFSEQYSKCIEVVHDIFCMFARHGYKHDDIGSQLFALLAFNRERYLSFLNSFLETLDYAECNEAIRGLIAQADELSDPEKKKALKEIFISRLRSVEPLTHFVRVHIIRYIGGRDYLDRITDLPLPDRLKRFVTL